MLHMHSKQYLHLLYTTLQALKTWQTTKKQIQFGLIAVDASQKPDVFNWLIGARAHCKHADYTLRRQPRRCCNITVLQKKITYIYRIFLSDNVDLLLQLKYI